MTRDGLSVRYVGAHLGGNRAVRCEPPLAISPFDALRRSTPAAGAGGGDEGRVDLIRSCCVAYYEVTLSVPPPSRRSHHAHHTTPNAANDAGGEPGMVVRQR